MAKQGKNILVDACIGSGKTTSIQYLCNELSDNRILYLTYNKLLKIDAREKIRNSNIVVNNYHGYAFDLLKRHGIFSGVSDLIQTLIKNNVYDVDKYELLILDEYQDIDLEISKMLKIIKRYNKNLQIIVVGDMCQKIYDKTALNVKNFIDTYLDNYVTIEYTKCFRLSKDYASRLGNIWGKEINGCNANCKIKEIELNDAKDLLSNLKTEEILCFNQPRKN